MNHLLCLAYMNAMLACANVPMEVVAAVVLALEVIVRVAIDPVIAAAVTAAAAAGTAAVAVTACCC